MLTEKQLKASGEPQISISDPESRQIMIRNNITEVAYSIQTTVDSKNSLPIDYKVTNQNDSKAMGNMVRRAKSILGNNEFTALYDKGYHTGSELKIAQDLGIEAIVAIPGIPSTSQAPDRDYNFERFNYDQQSDTYLCPQGAVLRSSRRLGELFQEAHIQSITKMIVKFIRRRNIFTRDVRLLLNTRMVLLNANGALVIYLQRRGWPGQVRMWALCLLHITSEELGIF